MTSHQRVVRRRSRDNKLSHTAYVRPSSSHVRGFSTAWCSCGHVASPSPLASSRWGALADRTFRYVPRRNEAVDENSHLCADRQSRRNGSKQAVDLVNEPGSAKIDATGRREA